MQLLKSQKATLFKLASESGISVADLKWGERLTAFGSIRHVPALLVNGTEYFFAFDENGAGPLSVFSPGHEELISSQEATNWATVLNSFRNWLRWLKRELAAPDPWAELEKQAVNFDLQYDDTEPARPFTVPEHRQVIRSLAVLQGLLVTYAKQHAKDDSEILAGIKRLEVASESQDRKAWFYLAVGFILSTAASLALAPDQTRALFHTLKDGLNGAITLIG